MPISIYGYQPPLSLFLAIALFGSLCLNLFQLNRDSVEKATAPLKSQIAGMEHTADTNNQLAKLGTQHQAELEAARAAAGEVQVRREVVYRDRVEKLEPAKCAPGADRVDAWNAAAIGEGR